MELLFLLVVLGTPAAICLIALIGAHFHQGDNTQLLDWQPSLSPEREAHLRHREVDEMLDAVNRYRRERDAPECTLQELSSPGGAALSSLGGAALSSLGDAARPSRDSRRRRAAPRP